MHDQLRHPLSLLTRLCCELRGHSQMSGLHYPRSCGCKGIRTCLACEGKDVSLENISSYSSDFQRLWRYCHLCGKVQPPPPPSHSPSREGTTSIEPQLSSPDKNSGCPAHHAGQGFILRGIQVIPNFVTDEEEMEMVHIIEQSPWKSSQSGRFKQDYGPKPNFKRRKVKQGNFTGLPSFIKPYVTRMTQLTTLQDFIPVEQCHLEYTPDRGSSIDLHFDDFWLWGNRLVTINLLSDTFLLLKLDTDFVVSGTKQNIDKKSHSNNGHCNGRTEQSDQWLVDELQIPMPKKSLLVLSDDARYKWKHAIPREAITSRRIAVTLRELASGFLPGGSEESVGGELIDVALTYEGSVVP